MSSPDLPNVSDFDRIVASLQQEVPGATFEAAPTVDLHTTIYARREDLPAVARALRDRPDLQYVFLAELTAVDYHPREPRFELVYLLVSLEHRHRLRLKVRLQGDDARVQSVTGVWPAANWLEREVWDLFGIVFDGHPDPRRLLMPEDWNGFPLRKDYPVQITMTPRSSEPLQVTAQEFRANLERDRLARS
jgi:NADH-quinone oxidoreductase subunit C